MTTATTPATRPHRPVASILDDHSPGSGPAYDWTMALLSLLLLAGVTLDIWAHNHGRTDETFFTPWHGLLYGMLVAVGIFLATTALWNQRRGFAVSRSLPAGYRTSLLGVAIFAGGGGFDLLWHSLFGFEADLETLLSPPHLLLALGGTLIVTGPLRSVWRRYPAGDAHGWLALGPAIIAVSLVLSVLTLFTQYAHPFVIPAAEASTPALLAAVAKASAAGSTGTDTAEPRRFALAERIGRDDLAAHLGGSSGYANGSAGAGIASIVLQSAFLMGTLLLLVRRWPLPFGALLLILGINGIVMVAQADEYRLLPAILVAGLVGDLLVAYLSPSADIPWRLSAFAFALPVVLYSGYFLLLFRDHGIAWSVHIWSGAILLAGITGLLLSFLVVPPLTPVEPADRA